MSEAKVKELSAEIIQAGVGMGNNEVMLALALATASIMKAAYTPELHDALLTAFVSNVRNGLKQMDTRGAN